MNNKIILSVYSMIEAAIIAIVCFYIGQSLDKFVYTEPQYLDGIIIMALTLCGIQGFFSLHQSRFSRVIQALLASITYGLLCLNVDLSQNSMLVSISITLILIWQIRKTKEGVASPSSQRGYNICIATLAYAYISIITHNIFIGAFMLMVDLGFAVVVWFSILIIRGKLKLHTFSDLDSTKKQ